MSLTKVNLKKTIKKQYFFKLKANIDAFSSLIGIQLLALLFSIGGVGSAGMGGSNISVNIEYYSADLVIGFTLIWAFVTAITITTKPYRNHDFTFVTNRLSSSLSNILFLLTASIVGGITAILAGNLLKVLAFIFLDERIYGVHSGLQELVMGIGVTIFYVFLVSSIGYFIGTLVQVSKLFIILISVLLFGTLFLEASIQKEPFLVNVFTFYTMESTLSLFIIKVIVTVAVFFSVAISILNRMEVRR
ncbi:hypothetical protein QUF81_16080 [Peribacillus simplex]|uniref:ABC transporter permease n=1 Tax=Peribacillus simplex TaxID=1478 RepID=A0AAW7IGS3_9BACI|nr:hypothetical protein [Peribacillus simplex]AMM93194.1 hypothetical protein UP17_12275 [Peribacillus simplex]MDM5294677.1 hypothetical protein [Peribacillus simplex]MDM5453629.1 hypothetical protein [Peribacillus simplex]